MRPPAGRDLGAVIELAAGVIGAERAGPLLFSSTEETNAVSIRMHSALGFAPSGHIDNLPQGYRELLFYKRLRA